MGSTFDIVVMGDINLDWCTKRNIPRAFSNIATNGIIDWVPIEEAPGGSGLNFARFAKIEGYSPLLLGKIGNDRAGKFISEWLNQHGLDIGVVESEKDTGKAFVVRDAENCRYVVNNEKNANYFLSVSDVLKYATEIESCKILYVSGYCLMNPEAPRAQAVRKAMDLAQRGNQTYVVFDVVPHRFYTIKEYDDLDKFKAVTREVDILISEVSTMRRYLHKDYKGEPISDEMADETAKHLTDHYNQFALRYGPSGCDEQIVWDGNNWHRKETGHDKADDTRGFGDRLALRALRDIFKLATAPIQVSASGR